VSGLMAHLLSECDCRVVVDMLEVVDVSGLMAHLLRECDCRVVVDML